MQKNNLPITQLTLFGDEEIVAYREEYSERSDSDNEAQVTGNFSSEDPFLPLNLTSTPVSPMMEDDDVEGTLSLDQQFPTQGALDYSKASQWISRRDALAIQYELEGMLNQAVDVVFTNNQRRMVSVRMDHGRLQVRLHHLFAYAEHSVLKAIAQMRMGDPAGRITLRNYVKEHQHCVTRTQSLASRMRGLYTQGKCLDLADQLEESRNLFKDLSPQITPTLPPPPTHEHPLAITWGRNGRGSRTIRFGSYSPSHHLIRIHPALDQDWVPSFFVNFVVYHEFLHSVIPAEQHQGRRVIHTETFYRVEQMHPKYEQALQWERKHVGLFLR